MAHSLRGRLVRAALAVVTGLLLLPATAAAAETTETLHLIPPTGSQHVGSTTLHLNDTSRADPWVSTVPSRELMVTLWYPTDARSGTHTQYMTLEEARLTLEGKHETQITAEQLSSVRTYAIAGAKPAGQAHSLPLIVLSPGYTVPRMTLTALGEDLASRGYVVAAIDHTYETYAVTFPDGRIVGCDTCAYDDQPGFFEKLYQVRAADVKFVIDRLTGAHPAWPGSRLIDATRIGMSGHSAGGASSISAMVADPRIDAGIDMDGSTRGILTDDTSFTRPFLFLGNPEHVPGGQDDSWDHDYSLMTGWKRWLAVTGTVHSSFTDVALFADQLGIEIGATTTGTRTTEITRRYTAAMFDLHLRHRPQPLLQGPSAVYPEVTFQTR